MLFRPLLLSLIHSRGLQNFTKIGPKRVSLGWEKRGRREEQVNRSSERSIGDEFSPFSHFVIWLEMDNHWISMDMSRVCLLSMNQLKRIGSQGIRREETTLRRYTHIWTLWSILISWRGGGYTSGLKWEKGMSFVGLWMSATTWEWGLNLFQSEGKGGMGKGRSKPPLVPSSHTWAWCISETTLDRARGQTRYLCIHMYTPIDSIPYPLPSLTVVMSISGIANCSFTCLLSSARSLLNPLSIALSNSLSLSVIGCSSTSTAMNTHMYTW